MLAQVIFTLDPTCNFKGYALSYWIWCKLFTDTAFFRLWNAFIISVCQFWILTDINVTWTRLWRWLYTCGCLFFSCLDLFCFGLTIFDCVNFDFTDWGFVVFDLFFLIFSICSCTFLATPFSVIALPWYSAFSYFFLLHFL